MLWDTWFLVPEMFELFAKLEVLRCSHAQAPWTGILQPTWPLGVKARGDTWERLASEA